VITFGSLFAGIGGIDLGLERAGMICKWQVEIDPFCQRVLAKHWPNVARYEDVRTVGKHNLEPVDLICGGFPCQDVSLAGEQAGLGGKRSTLWSEYARIVCEIKPKWILAENVVGLFSANDGRFFGNVLRDLAGLGYDAEWEVLPAAIFGAPHIRERVFILAYPCGVVGPLELFKRDGDEIIEWRENQGEWRQNWDEPKVGPAFIGGGPSYWECVPEPKVSRMVDGLPDELEQIRTYGNAVVPQVAEWIGQRIVETEEATHGTT
jgi:DNA (cytosine-5)-methyltransferase 1